MYIVMVYFRGNKQQGWVSFCFHLIPSNISSSPNATYLFSNVIYFLTYLFSTFSFTFYLSVFLTYFFIYLP